MKNTFRRVLNLALYVGFCSMAGTGLLLAWRLPPGSRGGAGLSALGLGRHDWGDLHTWISYAVMVLVIIHLAINWAWLKKIAASSHLWRLAVGLALGAAIIGFFLVVPVEKARRGQDEHRTR